MGEGAGMDGAGVSPAQERLFLVVIWFRKRCRGCGGFIVLQIFRYYARDFAVLYFSSPFNKPFLYFSSPFKGAASPVVARGSGFTPLAKRSSPLAKRSFTPSKKEFTPSKKEFHP